MKNLFKIILCLTAALAISLPLAAKKQGKAAIKFDSYRAKLGNVKEDGGLVSCDFVFKNTGDGNLVIIDAKATCGCTRPEYPKNPIAPGKTGKIKVSYNPKGRPGVIDRTVTITTNGKPKKVRLHIGGNVIPGK